jgi:hypothetical protein
MRHWLAIGLLGLFQACAAPPVVSEPPAAPSVADEPASPTRPIEPAEPTEAPVASSQAEAREVWRFTTLVTGGPEPLIGANGYYELVLEGDEVTIRKVGVRGTPQLPAERVMEGSGKLALTEAPAWPAAWSGTITVTLADAKSKQRMSLSLAVIGDALHGTWVHPDEKSEAGKIGRAWGLLEGVRGAGEPLNLVDGERAPCSICHQAFFVCEGMGSGACNSSNAAIAACDRRLRVARKQSATVPLGCGDWMRKG